MTKKLTDNLLFKCGVIMKNRFMLAPMTNSQSLENGVLSEEEYQWLTMRAQGQFGLVMTCASHVHENGKGFPGQLGIFSDNHIEGHQRLSSEIKKYGSLAVIQLHHAGMRSPKELIRQSPLCPSENIKFGAREMSPDEIIELRKAFVDAALRAKKSGYDGVEIHGAHGYIISQFLSSEINKRDDDYGGNLYNRSRLLFELVEAIRKECGDEFLLGVRLSPERFGMDINEIKEVCQQLVEENKIDFLDISLWDVFKDAEDEKYRYKSLLRHFTELDYKKVLFTVAGKIRTAEDVKNVINAGVDFVSVGRSGILHHDFPIKVCEDSNFKSAQTPVSEEYLIGQGLSPKFIQYMRKWPSFVKEA